MTDRQQNRPRPGDTVTLTEMPPGLLDDLPMEDRLAISEVVGKPVVLNEYDEDGRAELQFTDNQGVTHFIYVHPNFIRATE